MLYIQDVEYKAAMTWSDPQVDFPPRGKKNDSHQSFWDSPGWLAYLSSFKLSIPISERNYVGDLMCLWVIILFPCYGLKLTFSFNCQYGLTANVIKCCIFNLHVSVFTNVHWIIVSFLNLCHGGGLWVVPKLTCQWYHQWGFQTNGN